MKKILLSYTFFLIFILGVGKFASSETIAIEGLVDNFYKATELQKKQILKDNLGKEASGGGKVSNVEEYDLFDTTNDLKETYYQVTTEPQKTKNNVVYQLIFLFKEKDAAKDINKGQDIRKDAKITRIIDERLQISVWLLG